MELADLKEVGQIDFEFLGDPKILEVHVFISDKYSGKQIIWARKPHSSGDYRLIRRESQFSRSFLLQLASDICLSF